MADPMTAEQLRDQLFQIEMFARTRASRSDASAASNLTHIANTVEQLAARLSGMAAVPDGWRLVPLLPTDKMLDAAQTNETGGLITREARARIFRAMALDAPEPPHV